MLMVIGVVVIAFCNAVMGESFTAVVQADRKVRKADELLKNIFDSESKKGSDGKATMVDIYHALRRSDPMLAAEMDLYPRDLKVSFRLLQVLAEDARRQQQERGLSSSTIGRISLDTVYNNIEILREDQDMLAETMASMNEMLLEQQRVLRMLAKSSGVPVDSEDGSIPLLAGKQYHFFISHCQATGQDQAHLLCTNLKARGAKVWYDMEMDEITTQGMEDGVRDSMVMIVLLTPLIMSRPFCQLEMRSAKKHDLKIIGVCEQDERRGKVDFAAEKAAAPDDLKDILDKVEFLPFRRRKAEADPMYREILKRSQIV